MSLSLSFFLIWQGVTFKSNIKWDTFKIFFYSGESVKDTLSVPQEGTAPSGTVPSEPAAESTEQQEQQGQEGDKPVPDLHLQPVSEKSAELVSPTLYLSYLSSGTR